MKNEKPEWLYVGAECKTRDGQKVKITEFRGDDFSYPFIGSIEGKENQEDSFTWTLNGSYCISVSALDLVGPWKEPETNPKPNMKEASSKEDLYKHLLSRTTMVGNDIRTEYTPMEVKASFRWGYVDLEVFSEFKHSMTIEFNQFWECYGQYAVWTEWKEEVNPEKESIESV